MSNLTVTISPPTPNGPLHIGHISGPFLGADVYARAQRQRKHDCVLISYSDDYQSYMLRRGLELNMDHVELAKANTIDIKNSLQSVDIQIDHWMQPWKNPYFEQSVREVYQTALEAGAILFKEKPEPYCEDCGYWGYEAFGRGDCNYCGVDSDASQCENCALEPDSSKMVNFRCKLCGQPHQWRNVRRAYLKLDKFRDTLKTLYSRLSLRKPLNSWINEVVDRELSDWGVTRPSDAGLELTPGDNQPIHTWFMGLAGYMAAFREYAAEVVNIPELFDAYWKSECGQLVHFFGFDCAYSHAVVYPSLLSTLKDYRVQQLFYPNQFLRLKGLNFSTSRDHAIWTHELVEKACSDSIRLYLAGISPEESEGDFDLELFLAWRENVFVSFVERLLAIGSRYASLDWNALYGDEYEVIQSLRKRWLKASSLNNFSMRKLFFLVRDIMALARARLDHSHDVGFLAAALAVYGESLHPKLSRRIFSTFHIDRKQAMDILIDGGAPEYEI